MPESKRQIQFKTFLRNTVLDVMRSRGWHETDSETDWDFYWADVGWFRENYSHFKFENKQRINHFRNHYELTRKDLMVKNFKRMKKALEKEGNTAEASKYDFFPITFPLPADWAIFETEFKRRPNCVWIMKPPAKAQGKGIFLFTKLSQVSEWRNKPNYLGSNTTTPLRLVKKKNDADTTSSDSDTSSESSEAVEPYLAQRYIENPHLVGGKKYDLRIYVLVTSYSPLVVWLHRTGFARFCHSRFSMNDIENTYVHVTNVAVQKTNPKYMPSTGCKWGLRSLRQYLNATLGEEASSRVFSEMQAMIMRTLLSVRGIMINDKHCAELYGYDVMLDNQMKPMLIETNASPALTAETCADYHLKFNLLEDYFNVIDLEGRRTGDEIRVGGFDKIWDNGPCGVTLNDRNVTCVQSYLGCVNEFEIPITRMSLPPKLRGSMSSEQQLT